MVLDPIVYKRTWYFAAYIFCATAVRMWPLLLVKENQIANSKLYILTLLFLALPLLLQGFFYGVTVGMNRKFKQRLEQLFYNFYYPLIEEVLRFLFVFWLSRVGVLLYRSLACAFVIQSTVNNDMDNYYTFFSIPRFDKLYDLWINQDKYKTRLENLEEVESLLQSILNNEEYDRNRKSIVSTNSDDTLADERKLSIKHFPSSFNMKKSQSLSSTPMAASKSINTLSSLQSSKSHSILAKQKSAYDFVDKLYSISPKNTYHLNTATAIAALETNQENYAALDNEDPLSKVSYCHENIDEEDDNSSISNKDTHWGGGGGGNFKYKFPGGPKIEFGAGAGFDYRHSEGHIPDDDGGQPEQPQHPSHHTPSTSKPRTELSVSTVCLPYVPGRSNYTRSPVSWFSWLAPPFFSRDNYDPAHLLDASPILQQRLSTYRLNDEEQYPHRDSVDSRLQQPVQQQSSIIHSNSIERYYNFMYFVNYYFDFCLKTRPELVVDSCFKTYGILTLDMPLLYFLLDCTASICCESVSLLTFANFFMKSGSLTPIYFLASLVIVNKLFTINFLKNPENRFNFKFVIIIKALFAILLLLAWFAICTPI